MHLFLDTETTGLEPTSRLLQFAWLMYDDTGTLLRTENHYIKPVGFTIPEDATAVHGITTAYAKKNGKNLEDVLRLFLADAKEAALIIAHNIAYDMPIIKNECKRCDIPDPFKKKKMFCTMKEFTDICKIPGKKGYKRPNTTEMYRIICGKDIVDAHNALADIQACADCYRKIQTSRDAIYRVGSEGETNVGSEGETNVGSEGETNVGSEEETNVGSQEKINVGSEEEIPVPKEKKPTKTKTGKFSFDPIAQQALDLMTKTTKNIFLTGKAGTGKSTLLLHFLHTTTKNVVVLAPTGVAALNVGGATIHSFFRFSTTITEIEARKLGKKKKSEKMYTKLTSLVIDEISMVRADLFDCMDVFLQEAREDDRPFGGVQLIMIGDVYQLPPVVTSTEKGFFETTYKSPYFFSSRVFSAPTRSMELVELEKIYRQNDDTFVAILNGIRNKTITEEQVTALNTRVVGEVHDIPEGVLYLTGLNRKAEEINTKQLALVPGKAVEFYADINGDFQEKQYPTDAVLNLKVGAQVMFVANDALGQRVNGTLGKVVAIYDEERVEVELFNGDTVEVSTYTWEVKKYVYDHATGSLHSDAVGSFTQLPLILARAVTMHKSQGKTFDACIIDLGAGIFAHGQTYVALSRCRSLAGISLVHPLKHSHVIMDRKVVDFMTKRQYKKSADGMGTDEKVVLIQRAITEKKCLDITYLKAQDVKSQRVVEPLEVGDLYYEGKKFIGMRCFCHKRQAERVFRVDRILKMQEV